MMCPAYSGPAYPLADVTPSLLPPWCAGMQALLPMRIAETEGFETVGARPDRVWAEGWSCLTLESLRSWPWASGLYMGIDT